jgi:hypothetical protein
MRFFHLIPFFLYFFKVQKLNSQFFPVYFFHDLQYKEEKENFKQVHTQISARNT